MRYFRGQRLKGTVTLAPAAAVFCAALALASPVAAQDAERPLGILLPGVQQPQPDIRSPIPAVEQQRQATDRQATTDAYSGAGRPLGSLFNAPEQTTGRSGSVLPQDWNATAPAAAAPQAAADTPSGGNTERPLGTLFNTPSGRTPATSGQRSGNRLEARPIRPASRVFANPSSNATQDKPLGTLFGNQPATETRITGAPAPDTRRAAPVRTTAAPSSAAPSGPPPTRAEFSADSMTYDREMGLVVARGNVEVVYGTRSLLADQVTYNQKTDVVTADGNVSMTDETGKVLFGDKVEITGDLKDGVIYNIGLILEDKSRVAGNGARRSNGLVTEVNHAVYSPCNLCEDDPTAAPLWQIKAVRVIHDSEEKLITYNNAWLELFGVPVAYTPYLSHPDPTVKRRSGLLTPSFTNSSDLGFQVRAPYFFAIDDYQDATFTPMVSTKGGQGAIGQYRRNFKNGFVTADGSFVADDPDRGLRGYLDFESQVHIDKSWRAGLDVETASDDTYTRRYGFYTEPVLVSRGYMEGFRGQNYQVLNTYAFNDLRPDANPDDSPIVLPMYDFNYAGKRDRLGGFASFDFNALNIVRDTGTDTRRLAFRPRWDRPFSGPFGELYNASVSLAADAYHANGVERSDGTTFNGASGRLVPRASFSWRLPLIRPGTEYSQTIEPIASVVAAPNVGNTDKIPNEDSQALEFDETNLFKDNRYDGFDRVDGGLRVNYGVNWVLNHNEGGYSSVFLGQSYRPREDTSANQQTGLQDHFSDVVGRIQLSPTDYLDLLYRTQFSPDNLSPQRNEVDATIGTPALSLNTNYIFIDQQQGSEFAGREEINGSISSQINRNWRTFVRARNDLAASDLRSLGLGVVYEDECVRFTTQITRSFFEDRDLKPSDAITFTLVLKTLGEVHSGITQSQ
ncbi:MAG: LPS assembly protein LptD [Rhodospirillales bacterium]|nr:LPS assembly protein LptD [Rhodospirillales bacterium]